jgi:hypothetical protein
MTYELVGGPFDGVRIEAPMQIDYIKLQTPHVPVDYKPKLGELIVRDVCDAEYKDSACQEWQVEQYKAFPLFYNGINPFEKLELFGD